jgi:hypothetical protein
MTKVTAKIDLKTVEFLLDLPTEFSITDLKLEDNQVLVSFETTLDVPETVILNYQTDDYGNVALVGLDT